MAEISKPTFVGRFPVRREIPVGRPDGIMSPGQEELRTHGSVLLRTFSAIGETHDNTLDASYVPTPGDQVLVRGLTGGFWFAAVVEIGPGCHGVRCGERTIDIFFDERRQRWAVRDLT